MGKDFTMFFGVQLVLKEKKQTKPSKFGETATKAECFRMVNFLLTEVSHSYTRKFEG